MEEKITSVFLFFFLPSFYLIDDCGNMETVELDELVSYNSKNRA
jgi:hypothetical protein